MTEKHAPDIYVNNVTTLKKAEMINKMIKEM